MPGERHRDEGILLCFFDADAVVADLLEELRVLGNLGEIEPDLRCTQAGVELSERQQRFKFHDMPRICKRSAKSVNGEWSANKRLVSINRRPSAGTGLSAAWP